jgi:HEAT repeat protein
LPVDQASATGVELDRLALERLDEWWRKPAEYWGDIDALQAKFEATESRRERNRLLERAAVPLAKSGDPKALDFLAWLLRNPHHPIASWGVRGFAVYALGKAEPVAAPYLRALIEDGVVDAGVPTALGLVGSTEDVQLLLPFLRHRGVLLRFNTVLALDRLDGPGAREGFLLALSDRRFFVREVAIMALRNRCADLEVIEALDDARTRIPWYRMLARQHLRARARVLSIVH